MRIFPPNTPVKTLGGALFGAAEEDVEIAANTTWRGVHACRDLTVAAGYRLSADTTKFGPLVIRASGTLRLEAGAAIAADGKAVRYDGDSGDWLGNGGEFITGWESSWPYLGEDLALGVSGHRPWHAGIFPNPGGSGGAGGGTGGFDGQSAHVADPNNNRELVCPWLDNLDAIPGGFAPGGDGHNAWMEGYLAYGAAADYCDLFAGLYRFCGGCGGGAGGDDGSWVHWGPGGAGGGVLVVFARRLEIAATARLSANGADGDDGNGGDVGGGGGGAGGTVYVVTAEIDNQGTIEAAGGAGGIPSGSGGNGGDGCGGVARVYLLN